MNFPGINELNTTRDKQETGSQVRYILKINKLNNHDYYHIYQKGVPLNIKVELQLKGRLLYTRCMIQRLFLPKKGLFLVFLIIKNKL